MFIGNAHKLLGDIGRGLENKMDDTGLDGNLPISLVIFQTILFIVWTLKYDHELQIRQLTILLVNTETMRGGSVVGQTVQPVQAWKNGR